MSVNDRILRLEIQFIKLKRSSKFKMDLLDK
jgi:hypothetical protein